MRWENIKDVFKREHEISPNHLSFNSTQDMNTEQRRVKIVYIRSTEVVQ